MRDPAVHQRAIELATGGLGESGLGSVGITASPITGAEGNREFLLHARRGDSSLDTGSVRRAVYGEEMP